MMKKREIKFRGKDKINGNWVYGYYSEELCNGRLKSFIADVANWFEVDGNTIGQFTGLYDNNGKKVYEGDIIKSPNGNIVIVEFGTHEERVHSMEASLSGYKADSFECTGWIVRNIKNNTIGFLDYSFLKGGIIGNIYDDKELLKGN